MTLEHMRFSACTENRELISRIRQVAHVDRDGTGVNAAGKRCNSLLETRRPRVVAMRLDESSATSAA